MPSIPRNHELDSTLALLRDGYRFISIRCDHYGTDIFQTRLLLQKTICMRGRQAAALFYDRDRFIRAGATPGRVKKTLFGEGGVQGLDGEPHRHRKRMFMALMTPAAINTLVDITTQQWRAYVKKWAAMDEVILYDEVSELLCRSVCSWTGVPLNESEVGKRTQELVAMIEAAGAVTFGYLQGRFARRRAEVWAADLIRRVRSRSLVPAENCGLYIISWHRDQHGELLNEHDAAVELLNVLRPTVAIGRFITFAALALHEYPACREALRNREDDYLELFTQEVRRYYPFFPFVAARVRRPFIWRGYQFSQGTRVLLDLYGTNHDAACWNDPEIFRPERFSHRDDDAYDFIPQGGGDHYLNHRCPGEWITIVLIKKMTEGLMESMDYVVPAQDLSIDLSTVPALPASRFIISKVRATR